VIVVDASAAVLALLNDDDARGLLAREPVAAPHLIDSEIANALRSNVIRGGIEAGHARRALDSWARLGVRRFPVVGLLGRVWELRANLTAYDASYVALAETLGGDLVTADARLAAAPGPTCAVRVVRS
jgi:predicted nucleic acid-binding protein